MEITLKIQDEFKLGKGKSIGRPQTIDSVPLLISHWWDAVLYKNRFIKMCREYQKQGFFENCLCLLSV